MLEIDSYSFDYILWVGKMYSVPSGRYETESNGLRVNRLATVLRIFHKLTAAISFLGRSVRWKQSKSSYRQLPSSFVPCCAVVSGFQLTSALTKNIPLH